MDKSSEYRRCEVNMSSKTAAKGQYQLKEEYSYELSVCSTKLDELAVEKFDNANADNEYKGIKARFLHVNDRLKEIAAGPMTERKKQYLQFYWKILSKLLSLPDHQLPIINQF
ncbi:hypothetical protein ILUMI_16154 [Ignelater luminosus]|uniref:Uncharacterized protein n=1 Tax=Ignelater luminosus TaxID=2038154 RepID=A0A8K0CM91_IGNLU|nr:hypothetical protein ILUMI_16154 [Ignelater luminosus]